MSVLQKSEVDLSKIWLHLLCFGKNVAETCFNQDGLNHWWQKLTNPVLPNPQILCFTMLFNQPDTPQVPLPVGASVL